MGWPGRKLLQNKTVFTGLETEWFPDSMKHSESKDPSILSNFIIKFFISFFLSFGCGKVTDKENHIAETKVQNPEQPNQSARTTIPKAIFNKLGLEDGDKIKWDLKVKGTHAGKAFVEKVEEVEE